MPVTQAPANASFPPTVAAGAREALESTLGSILGTPPECRASDDSAGTCSGLVGIISFVGDLPWTFSLLLPHATASAIIRAFAGFDIPSDSPDMADVVGELANVIAGDVVARLDRKGIRAQMSLPSVLRGHDIELTSVHGGPWVRFHYGSTRGEFALALAAAKGARVQSAMPGK
jgi:CheY-specific phosphatase CheX